MIFLVLMAFFCLTGPVTRTANRGSEEWLGFLQVHDTDRKQTGWFKLFTVPGQSLETTVKWGTTVLMKGSYGTLKCLRAGHPCSRLWKPKELLSSTHQVAVFIWNVRQHGPQRSMTPKARLKNMQVGKGTDKNSLRSKSTKKAFFWAKLSSKFQFIFNEQIQNMHRFLAQLFCQWEHFLETGVEIRKSRTLGSDSVFSLYFNDLTSLLMRRWRGKGNTADRQGLAQF